MGGLTDMLMVTPQRSRKGTNARCGFGGARKFEEFFDRVMAARARCLGGGKSIVGKGMVLVIFVGG